MERQPEPREEHEQLTLFEVRTFLGRTVLISENICYPLFGEPEHDPFIDDLNGFPDYDDAA